ncbi:MAG: hypothetical protein IJH38_02400 [Clostridia bacterium]|nr:hypothetical protein [Clostridia bacterium]
MPRLWARIIRGHRIIRQATEACAWEDVPEALTALCHEFDIPRPLWLDKHKREFEAFHRTQFLPDHFMEDVTFQRLEIEFLEDDENARRSRDPRNEFDSI